MTLRTQTLERLIANLKKLSRRPTDPATGSRLTPGQRQLLPRLLEQERLFAMGTRKKVAYLNKMTGLMLELKKSVSGLRPLVLEVDRLLPSETVTDAAFEHPFNQAHHQKTDIQVKFMDTLQPYLLKPEDMEGVFPSVSKESPCLDAVMYEARAKAMSLSQDLVKCDRCKIQFIPGKYYARERDAWEACRCHDGRLHWPSSPSPGRHRGKSHNVRIQPG